MFLVICNIRNGRTSRLPNIVFLQYMHILRGIWFLFICNDLFSNIIMQNMVLKRAEFQRSSVLVLKGPLLLQHIPVTIDNFSSDRTCSKVLPHWLGICSLRHTPS